MTMKYWPVPDGHGGIPLRGSPGSFWEDRGDRRHCGVDLYAPAGSPVYAVEHGTVIETDVMTSPDILSYWNTTHSVLIRHGALVAKYGELHDVTVAPGDIVRGGDLVGHVGTVLNPDAITAGAPQYIRRLGSHDDLSMLHFELYRAKPPKHEAYLGGNWFGDSRPGILVDPTGYLMEAADTPSSAQRF